jgi:hypothetical protein
MRFRLSYVTRGALPESAALAHWLTEQGEPVEAEPSPAAVALRALPVVFHLGEGLAVEIMVRPAVPLTRLVDLLFSVSVRAGADLHLDGEGEVSRPALFLRLADEQDRQRLASALLRARDLSSCHEISRRLWALVNALRPGHDDRWDGVRERIVEVLEVGEGLSLAAAQRIHPEVSAGDEVHVPVRGSLHTLAWRWFRDAYPALAEDNHSLH